MLVSFRIYKPSGYPGRILHVWSIHYWRHYCIGIFFLAIYRIYSYFQQPTFIDSSCSILLLSFVLRENSTSTTYRSKYPCSVSVKYFKKIILQKFVLNLHCHSGSKCTHVTSAIVEKYRYFDYEDQLLLHIIRLYYITGQIHTIVDNDLSPSSIMFIITA